MSKRIVIVGGGYLGTELARSLEKVAEVTLVEPRRVFVHTPAMIRAVVEPSLLDRALIPYGNLMSRGRIVHRRASAIDAEGVTLEDGTRLPADLVVVATGSANAMPFKARGADVEGLRAANADIHARLAAAGSVAILGAGPVGIELAGEIAYAMPQKSLTLVASGASLLPDMPPRLGRSLRAKLEAAGVEVILGARAEGLDGASDPFAGAVTLSDGRGVEADLVFPVFGSLAEISLLETLPGARVSPSKRVIVDPWLRPSDLAHVFAAGDAAETGDLMTIVGVSRQRPWLTRTLRALLGGRRVEDLRPYAPWRKAPILVPLGPKKGASFLIAATAGDWPTRMMKGKDLFVTKYRKALGAD